MRYSLALVFLMIAIFGYSQNVVVIEDPEIADLMQRYQAESKAIESVKGWRIQIITTDDRRKMEAAKSKFYAMHPDLYLEWEHVVPYYKIKVGAYREKIDLQSFLVELRHDFPSAIPIQDEVNKRELVY